MTFISSTLRQTSGAARAALALFLAVAPAAQTQTTPPAPKPAPDVVIFTNGDQLTGTLEHGAGNSIVFKSDMAGEITISLDKVKELHTGDRFAVLRKDAKITSVAAARANVVQGTVIYGDGKLIVTPTNAEPQTIPEAQIGNIFDEPSFLKDTSGKSSFTDGWNGAVNGGATIVRATDYGETFTAGINLVRAMPTVSFLPPSNRTLFNLQETYGKLTSPVIPQTTPPTPAAVTVTSIFHAGAERDEYFSPRLYALGQTAFDHNYSQGLNLQQLYGGGIGWTAIKSDKQQLDFKGTIQYEMQTYLASSGTPNQNIIGSTISEAYHRSLPHKLVFTESISALPAWNNTNDYSANGSVSLAMPVFKRLSLTFTTTDTFLNDPAFGYNKNSFQFITAASYTLK